MGTKATGDLYAQLLDMIGTLQVRAQAIFGPGTAAFTSAQALARDYVGRLTGLTWEDAESTCRELAIGLLSEQDLHDEAFWKTPLGRLMSWHIGYPAPYVHLKLLGSLIGVSRQYAYRRAHELGITKGRIGDGAMTISSTDARRLVRERRPTPLH
jgi:hypothetical protein